MGGLPIYSLQHSVSLGFDDCAAAQISAVLVAKKCERKFSLNEKLRLNTSTALRLMLSVVCAEPLTFPYKAENLCAVL